MEYKFRLFLKTYFFHLSHWPTGWRKFSMFDFRKVLQVYGASTAPAGRLDAVYSPRFGRAYRSSLTLPLTTEFSTKMCILLVTAMIVYGGFQTLADFRYMLDELRLSRTGWMFFYAFRALVVSNIVVFLWRILLVLGYKPAQSCTDEQLPVCTVIIPAYNEGKQVLKTLRSVLKSNYPLDKLQIITVNDGSADDTLVWMQKGCGESDGRIELINFEKNRGKRAALYEGIVRSRGQIIVTIDSDSIIDRQTLRRLVSPFADSQVGAVAGNVRVLNRKDGIIPKMLDVTFAYSFDFIRASQSMVNTVFCTPGALSAYRKSVIRKDLKNWLHQTFLGQPATIGEDRAMTNIVLRNGYDVKFQSNAIVYTMVPTEYKQLCKMFLRWARSNVRETCVMIRYIFKKFRTGSASGARVNFVVSFINPVLSRVLCFAVAGWLLTQPYVYLSQLLFGGAVASTAPVVFYVLRRRSTEAVWAYVYGWFWLAGLWWINIWAVLTMRNGKWLTRDLPAAGTPAVVRLLQKFRLRAA